MSKVKQIIEEYLEDALYGIFFTRNIMGDQMSTIYKDDQYTIDICWIYGYFEIFGCTAEEKVELEEYYDTLITKYYNEMTY